MSSTGSGPGGRAGTIAAWVVTVAEVAMMLPAGAAKFVATEFWLAAFGGWGYPSWLAFVVGGAEVTLALALLFPRLAAWAAVGLVVIMVGAGATLLAHPGGPLDLAPVALHLGLLSVVLVLRWPVRWRPGGSGS